MFGINEYSPLEEIEFSLNKNLNTIDLWLKMSKINIFRKVKYLGHKKKKKKKDQDRLVRATTSC